MSENNKVVLALDCETVGVGISIQVSHLNCKISCTFRPCGKGGRKCCLDLILLM